MPKVTEAHRRARRQQILRAAFACFGREGFHGTTMHDVCEEADLSPGAVYNYFDGKDDIIRAIAEESRDALDALFETIDEEQPAPQVLAALLERLGAFAEQPSDAAEGGHRVRVRLWGEALNTSDVRDPFRENLDHFIGRVAGIVREGQEKGTISQDVDPEGLARALLAFHQGTVLQKAVVSSDSSLKPVFDAMHALLRGAVS